MKLTLKRGVSLLGTRPEMCMAAVVVASVYSTYNNAECVITSACEGKHGRNSLHYVGLALDFRIKNIPIGWHDRLRQSVQDALGPDFDVVLEKTHLHVEFQPE